ncbi:hypothetical protein [Flavobacterium sp. 7A]|uniref:hypothetical protein n=1 Tax=Flavobacterium sp. 7A TaxID=2940571 RepID=UPI0022264084|nr:hypothetical protein [Flavobacterium sp. 7A]MCW2119872.1 hypothetical protein [Flavobacterium sp. 7A]
MNTQFAKVGKIYPKVLVALKQDDSWSKSPSFNSKDEKNEKIASIEVPQNYRLWKK